MNISKRLEAVEKALNQQRGFEGFRLAHRAEGETDEQAIARAGLTGWTGPVIFLRFPYAKLPQYQTNEDTK